MKRARKKAVVAAAVVAAVDLAAVADVVVDLAAVVDEAVDLAVDVAVAAEIAAIGIDFQGPLIPHLRVADIKAWRDENPNSDFHPFFLFRQSSLRMDKRSHRAAEPQPKE